MMVYDRSTNSNNNGKMHFFTPIIALLQTPSAFVSRLRRQRTFTSQTYGVLRGIIHFNVFVCFIRLYFVLIASLTHEIAWSVYTVHRTRAHQGTSNV